MGRIKKKKYNKEIDELEQKFREKKKKDNFYSKVLLFIFLLIALILPNFMEKGSSDYYHAQNALFVVIVAMSMLFIVRRNYLPQAIKNIKQAKKIDMVVLTDILELTNFVLAMIGILVLDISFISHYGIRIGGVVGFNLAMAIKGLWQYLKNK